MVGQTCQVRIHLKFSILTPRRSLSLYSSVSSTGFATHSSLLFANLL